ncbi:MAG TPA: hypothetical protein VK171_12255, partial [Fimbriimonas sp.]|nr:hypothetical protein [Fimbriimonas sp.]
MLLPLLVGSSWLQSTDDCLLFVTHNLAKGDGNWFTYYKFSNKKITFRKGDKLTYEIFLDARNPIAKGSIDVDLDQGDPLRDRGLRDDGDRRAHGDGDL